MMTTLTNTATITADLPAVVRWAGAAAREFGTAEVTIPRNNAAFSSVYVDHDGGSLVEIKDGSLGTWRGMVAQAKVGKNGATLSCTHLAKILDLRVVSRARVLIGMTAGAIVKAAVSDAVVGLSSAVLRAGTFVEAAPAIDRYEFRGQKLSQVLAEMMEQSGQEWSLSDDGALSWVPPAGTLYSLILCDDGDVTGDSRDADINERTEEVIGRGNDGRESAFRNSNTGLWPKQDVLAASGSNMAISARQAAATAQAHSTSQVGYPLRLKNGPRVVAAWPGVVMADAPAGWWRLNETTGSNLLDSSGNGNTAAMTGSPTLGVPGLIAGSLDTAVQFNGSTQFATAADAATLDPGDVLSIEAVFALRALGGNYAIIDKDTNGYRLYISTTGVVTFQKANVATLMTGTIIITDLLPHHILITKNTTTLKMYIDGVECSSVSATTAIAATASPMVLGELISGAFFFNGVLDEVVLYPTALSAARAQAHYDAFKGGHIATIREGDYLQTVLPYADFAGAAPLVRVLSRSYSDGDADEELRVQNVPAYEATTIFRAVGEAGPAQTAPPKSKDADAVAMVSQSKDDLAALNGRIAEVEENQKRVDAGLLIGALAVDAGGNLLLKGGAGVGGGAGVVSIPNATTVPVSNPALGGLLYVTAGGLVFRGSAGTVTAIAPA